MGRRATTLDEQLILLRSRGMTLDLSEEKTKEILAANARFTVSVFPASFTVKSVKKLLISFVRG